MKNTRSSIRVLRFQEISELACGLEVDPLDIKVVCSRATSKKLATALRTQLHAALDERLDNITRIR